MATPNRILRFATFSDFPATGDVHVLYIDQSTGVSYNWVGAAYAGAINFSGITGSPYTNTALRRKLQRLDNIEEYGAVADGVALRDAIMTSGSAVLTSASASFTTADIGKTILVTGAGATGNAYKTTILSRQSATQITLSANASTSVSGVDFFYGTDNADAYDDTIAFVNAAGIGSVYTPTGHFITSREIVVPGNNVSGAKVIAFVGEGSPSQWVGTVTEDPLAWNGSILQCLSTTAGEAIIRSAPGATLGFSLMRLKFKGLDLRTYNNPAINSIDCQYASQMVIEDCFINTGVFSVAASAPTHGTKGIITPGLNNGACTLIYDTQISGYDTGIVVNEHSHIDGVIICCTARALDFKTANHPSYIGRIGLYRNQINVQVSGAHTFRVLQAAIEHANISQTNANNVWQMNTYDIYDPTNLGVCDDFRYWVILGNVGYDATFTVSGASGIDYQEIGTIVGGGGGGSSLPAGLDWTSPVFSITASNAYAALNASSGHQTAFIFKQNGTTRWQMGSDSADNGTIDWYLYDQVNTKFKIRAYDGKVMLGNNALTGPAITIPDGTAGLPEYASNALALAALGAGVMYRNGDDLKITH